MEVNKIYCENCIDTMARMPDAFVDLTVTSPPYDNLRDYSDPNAWTFDVFKQVADEIYRVTKTGGILVWVVGDAVIKNSESGNSFRQALYFMDLGFKLHDTMLYEKNSSPFPARRDGNRYTQVFEYMFVFSKDVKPKTANLICDKPNRWVGHTSFGKSSIRTKEGFLVERDMKPIPEYSPRNNIWKYNTGKKYTTKDDFAFHHPAMFPEKLAEDHILTWSVPGNLVMDPFMGAGTTAKMAFLNGRDYIGSEISKEYCEIAEMRVNAVENKPFSLFDA